MVSTFHLSDYLERMSKLRNGEEPNSNFPNQAATIRTTHWIVRRCYAETWASLVSFGAAADVQQQMGKGLGFHPVPIIFNRDALKARGISLDDNAGCVGVVCVGN